MVPTSEARLGASRGEIGRMRRGEGGGVSEGANEYLRVNDAPPGRLTWQHFTLVAIKVEKSNTREPKSVLRDSCVQKPKEACM